MAVGVLNNAFRQSSSLQLNPLEKSLPVPQGNNANEQLLPISALTAKFNVPSPPSATTLVNLLSNNLI